MAPWLHDMYREERYKRFVVLMVSSHGNRWDRAQARFDEAWGATRAYYADMPLERVTSTVIAKLLTIIESERAMRGE